jgi:hypothetical protein
MGRGTEQNHVHPRARTVRAAALLLSVFAMFFVSACGPSVPFASGTVPVKCCADTDEPVEITFLGTMGWLIQKGGVSILTAPLYSNPDLLHAGLGAIEAEPARIEYHLTEPVANVSAILVGHGHYDHAMDVPYVAMKKAPRARVFANETAAIQMTAAGLPASRIDTIFDRDASSVDTLKQWIDVPGAPGVRLLPLRSHHGPHFAGYTLYEGVRERDMSEPPRTADEWLDGNTIAFLIDFLKPDGSVAFRIYFQDAVPEPPYGFIPKALRDHPPDVALIVPSTYGEVQWHPERFLLEEKPRHVLLGHWENFFEPPVNAPDRPEPVPFTSLEGFIHRLERSLPAGTGWHIPVPHTRFIFDPRP